MFLTRMALDENREETKEFLYNPGRMQREIRAAFAGGTLQPLYRLDSISSRLWLVVLSRLRPTMYQLHERYGYPGVFPSWETFDYDETLYEAENGTTWNFELTAAPQGIMPDRDPNLTDVHWLTQWLAHQGDQCGFELKSAEVPEAAWIPADDAYILEAVWTGVLTVRDQETFTWSVENGIGNGRENGLGLMTIARNHTFWED